MNGVADGIRTHDNRNHNPGLYQLSYSHRSTLRRADRAFNPEHRATVTHAKIWRARQDSNLLPPA